ncbi:hypothetical protein J4229_01990 [Candidatus Pacearchaeota archaeon]|nr:hypothetical protein [Candidatus Pacearchaeota archaeon]
MVKKIVECHEHKEVLSKKAAWIILIVLVLLDAFLDLIFAEGKGASAGIWKPISTTLGIDNPIFLTPFVLILFFVLVKAAAFLARKIDRVPCSSEELVLTTLVLVYGLFDIWLLSVYLFSFGLFRNQFYLIPILIVVGIAYEWWADNRLKRFHTKLK